MILCKKIGAGKVHVLGGLLCCIGMTCTAYCKNAWQALLANGIVTGMFCTDAYLSNVMVLIFKGLKKLVTSAMYYSLSIT